jgi:hypothetical protein
MTNSLVLPARARFGALLAAALLVLSALVLVPGTSAQAAAGGTTLSAGQTLRSGQSISNGGYRLVMQSDGNAVVYASGGRVRWHTRTNGNSGSRLAIQTDGNLVVYSRYSKPLWHIGPDSGVKTVSATGLYAIRSGLPVGACGDPVGLARSMATKRSLFHGGSGWHGQIVAVGSDSSSLVNAWRNSPPHMTVARDGSWTRMSAGAARGTDGRMYGVVNFCR